MSPLNITQPLDSIRYMVYNGYYKVMSNIPKMGHLPTSVTTKQYIAIPSRAKGQGPFHKFLGFFALEVELCELGGGRIGKTHGFLRALTPKNSGGFGSNLPIIQCWEQTKRRDTKDTKDKLLTDAPRKCTASK